MNENSARRAPILRKRGRPRGSYKGKPTINPKWNPSKWHPEYEKVVGLATLGYTNIQISQMVGYSKEHVSNILNTPTAKTLLFKASRRLRETVFERMEDRLESIASKTVERMHELIHDDEKFDQKPLAIIDRGIKIMQGIGKLKTENNSTVNNNGPVITGEAMQILMEGMSKADAAKKLHSGKEEIVIEQE